jgi:hypothetical protein
VVLGALLHLVLPAVAALALVLLVIGRRGRLFLRILLLGAPTRPPLSAAVRRARLWSGVALLGGVLCAARAAEAAATSVPQPAVVWTMTSLAVLLAVGGGIGLGITGRRRALAERHAPEPPPVARYRG